MSNANALSGRRLLAQALAVALAGAAAGNGMAAQPHDALPVAGTGADGLPPNAPYVVGNCNDSGSGSLREAMSAASGSAVIDLSQLSCSTITLTTGALTDPSADALQLLATPRFVAGRPLPVLTIDAAGHSRVIEHRGSGNLNLRGLDLRNGHANGGGGCLYSTGSITATVIATTGCVAAAVGTGDAIGGGIASHSSIQMSFSTISGNAAHADGGGNAYGGGIFAFAGASVSYSTIANNFTTGIGYGGGIAASGPVSLHSSVVNGNAASYGGGVSMFGGSIGSGDLHIDNSTIAGNHATGFAAGVEANGALTVSDSTIAGNVGDKPQSAAGIVIEGANPLHLDNSIVATNTQNGVAHDIVGAASIDGQSNLIGVSAVMTPGDTIFGDPLLGPLADNGGQTLTMSLLPGSRAIDAGHPSAANLCDQRAGAYLPGGAFSSRYPRSLGIAQDIGAFESGLPDAVFRNGFEFGFALLCHPF